MKVYIASFFDTRLRLRPHADRLWRMGYEVVSSWLHEVAKPESMTKEEFWRKLALKDLTEIKSADVLILDTTDVTPRGGREVEFGFALGGFQGKLIILVGPVRNVFHTLVDRRYDSWEALFKVLPPLPTASVEITPRLKKVKK